MSDLKTGNITTFEVKEITFTFTPYDEGLSFGTGEAKLFDSEGEVVTIVLNDRESARTDWHLNEMFKSLKGFVQSKESITFDGQTMPMNDFMNLNA